MTTVAPPAKKKSSALYLALFLGPALLFLGAMVLYPAIRTVYDSFFDRFGEEFVGFDNYTTMFGLGRMRTAILNSFLWTAIFPVLVTSVGLVLAVLAEKIQWKTAFKLILFLPIAIAVMSSGIIWRIMYDQSPDRGLVNAVIDIPVSLVSPAGDYPGAVASDDDLIVDDDGTVSTVVMTDDGGAVALIGLIRISGAEVPDTALPAVHPDTASGTITGVVWRDTRPGDNERGVVEEGELGLPGLTVLLNDSSGDRVASTVTGDDGTFRFGDLESGDYIVAVPGSQFREGWEGIAWLGPSLVTPSAILVGLWIWAGFALVVVGAGLAALPRDVIEAAKVDGASDWQVFRRITLPLLAPVLGVVFVTLTINALKMFDLIVGIAPGSVQDDANVIALEMWRTAFTGLGNRGLGAAIAVFLFLLIIPILAFNLRRFRIEEERR